MGDAEPEVGQGQPGALPVRRISLTVLTMSDAGGPDSSSCPPGSSVIALRPAAVQTGPGIGSTRSQDTRSATASRSTRWVSISRPTAPTTDGDERSLVRPGVSRIDGQGFGLVNGALD